LAMDARSLSNEELLELYLSHLAARNKSSRTVKSFKSILKSFLEFMEGRHLTSVNIWDVDAFLARLKSRGYGDRSIYTAAVAVKRFLEYLGLKDSIRGFELPKRPQPLPRYLTPEEVDKMVRAAEGLRDKVIISMLYTTGLRVSELVSVKMDDVNLEERTVRVYGKGGKERIVFFDEKTGRLLQEYIGEKPEGEYLFPGGRGGHMHYVSVERIVKMAAAKAGLRKKVTPHVLRHSFATYALSQGMDIREIQELLGHASLRSTQIYTHVSRRRLKEDYERIWNRQYGAQLGAVRPLAPHTSK